MYRGGGYTATIERHQGRYLLEVRDRRGRMTTRRWHRSYKSAQNAMWRWIGDSE